jgi:N-acetylglucosamine kinase-like BadF-type ATPase
MTTPKGQQAIVVSILGTGSNCSYFDGKELHQKTITGYIVMDDCSGNVFGKELIRKYYFNKMPKELGSVRKEYDLEPDSVKSKLYRNPIQMPI